MPRDVEFNYTASDRTGPAADSVARRATKTQDKIRREQDKAQKDFLKHADEIAGAGSKIGVLFGENVASSFTKMGPALTPVLAGVAIASAPLIGATIAGAIIGGAGIGGVIGGVLLAAKSPEVKARADSLGQTIMGGLRARAAVFIDPVLDSMDIIENRWGSIGGNVGRIFNNSAQYVKPLTLGVTYAVDKVTALVAKLTDVGTAGPVIESISMGIAGLGEEIDDAFSRLTDNGVDAAVALQLVFAVLQGTIRATGVIINGLTETFGTMAKFGLLGQRAQQEYFRLSANAKLAADSGVAVADSLRGVNSAGEGAAAVIVKLAEGTERLTGANQSLYASETNAAQAIANSTKKINENGKGLSLNTARGRENRQALSNLAQALTSNYDAYVKVNGAGAGAERVANRNRQAFIGLAQKAGYSAGEARKLADRLLGIPARRTPQVNLTGNAARRADEVIDKIRQIRGKTVTINIVRNTIENITKGLKKVRTGGYSGAGSWAAAAADSGEVSRTGGPVEVTSRVDVSLDGRPFRQYTARAIRDDGRRRDWRARIGTRVGVAV